MKPLGRYVAIRPITPRQQEGSVILPNTVQQDGSAALEGTIIGVGSTVKEIDFELAEKMEDIPDGYSEIKEGEMVRYKYFPMHSDCITNGTEDEKGNPADIHLVEFRFIMCVVTEEDIEMREKNQKRVVDEGNELRILAHNSQNPIKNLDPKGTPLFSVESDVTDA